MIRAGSSDKYGQVYVERVGNTGFPDPDEPVALLRAQDRHALAAMATPDAQRQSVATQVYRFQEFRIAHPEKLRTPGVAPARQ
jgi:hypothetical protein